MAPVRHIKDNLAPPSEELRLLAEVRYVVLLTGHRVRPVILVLDIL